VSSLVGRLKLPPPDAAATPAHTAWHATVSATAASRLAVRVHADAAAASSSCLRLAAAAAVDARAACDVRGGAAAARPSSDPCKSANMRPQASLGVSSPDAVSVPAAMMRFDIRPRARVLAHTCTTTPKSASTSDWHPGGDLLSFRKNKP
jgi:hypothetical protein